jgi:GT2 family glycosyltransferase
VPAALFHQIGGFDAEFRAAGGEDRAFCDDWRAHGHGLIFLPAAIVWHAHALNLRSFWQQHLAYGRGAFRYHTRSAAANRLEAAPFYLRLVTAPFSQHLPHSTALTCLLLLAQVATAAGFVHAAADNRRANVR